MNEKKLKNSKVSPDQSPKFCENPTSEFKSETPLVDRKSMSLLAFSDLPLNLTGQQCFSVGTKYSLYAYVATFLLGAIPILPQTSVPFVLGSIFVVLKFGELIVNRESIRICPEGLAFAILYLYLIGADYFLHGGTIMNAYYISFGLNCVMLLLLVDEFQKDPNLREKVMRIFTFAAVAVAMLSAFSIMTAVSQSGRLTVMGQNENELAAALLIAYIYLSIDLSRSRRKNKPALGLMFVSAALLLNALINTGTRFALLGVIAVLVLLALSILSVRDKSLKIITYVLLCGVFIGFKVFGFLPTIDLSIPSVNSPTYSVNSPAPLIDRFSPEVHGNNLADLGGRVQLWQMGIDAFSQSPLIGMGYSGYQQFVLKCDRFFGMPHNFFVQIAATGGLVGILLLVVIGLMLASRIFSHGNRWWSSDALIWSVPLVLLLMMLNITHLKIFWFLLAYFITFDSGSRIIFARPSVRSI